MRPTHLLLLAIGACGAAAPPTVETAPQHSTRVSPDTGVAPAPNEPTATTRGAALFASHCQRCHGDGYAPNLFQSDLSRANIRARVRGTSYTKMPSFSVADIGEADLEELLDYVVARRSPQRE